MNVVGPIFSFQKSSDHKQTQQTPKIGRVDTVLPNVTAGSSVVIQKQGVWGLLNFLRFGHGFIQDGRDGPMKII